MGGIGYIFTILSPGNGGGPDGEDFKFAGNSGTGNSVQLRFENSGNGNDLSPDATGPIDSNGDSRYQLTVRVTDAGTPTRFTDQNITVDVVRPTGTASSIVYYNPSFGGDAGQTLILDADPVTPGNQPATFGSNAFNNLNNVTNATGGQIKFVPNAGSQTVTVGGNDIGTIPANTAFVVDAGVTATMTARLRGSNPLIKAGAGTLVLTNTDNDFSNTGTTPAAGQLFTGVTINNGRLRISSNALLGNGGNIVTVNSPGVFESVGNWSTSRTFFLNNGATLNVANGTLTMNGSTVNGGSLSGPGTIATGLNNTVPTVFTGTRSTSSLVLERQRKHDVPDLR